VCKLCCIRVSVTKKNKLYNHGASLTTRPSMPSATTATRSSCSMPSDQSTCQVPKFQHSTSLNDTSTVPIKTLLIIFYIQQKGVGCRQDREREKKERRVRGRVWVKKGCSVDHKLGRWPSTYDSLEKG
jgi:hypothetical protein